MAITTSKVTYSLKPETVLRIEELAVKWGVPKSEVIRRVVDQAAENTPIKKKETPLEIFLRLQTKDGISPVAAAKYLKEVRAERRAWGRKKK